MVKEYAMKIEHIFYLKENKDLTTEKRNILIQNILAEMKKEAMRIGHYKGVALCKNALNGLENANSSNY
jgi:hypothetical protein